MILDKHVIGRGWQFPIRINANGGFALTSDENEIGQAIRVILTTIPGERVMRPTFGSRLHELVFAPINVETMALARRFVEQAIRMWEPRIELITVDIVVDEEQQGCLLIKMEYQIRSTYDRRTLVYPFYTIPEEYK